MVTVTVPQDLDAERALLGAMLLSPDAVEVAVSRVEPGDLASPMHAAIFRAIAALWGDGRRADVVSVVDRMRADGGGDYADAAALVGLQADTPSVANTGTYAEIVVRHAAATRLQRIAQGMLQRTADRADPYELADDVAAQLAAIEAPVDLSRQAARTLDDLVSTSDAVSPWVVPGLLRTDWRCVLVGFEGSGKAQRLDEPVPTPSGWARFGDLVPGDELFDSHGAVCRVVAVGPVDLYPDARAVTFSDGTRVECHAEHLWPTVDAESRQGRVHLMVPRSAALVQATLWARGGHQRNHAVPAAGALQLPERGLPVDPYVLGVWLGDGSTDGALLTLNRADAPAVESRVTQAGMDHHRVPSGERAGSVAVRVSGLQALLRAVGVLGYKHVPEEYLRGSVSQRKALLAGLMDTDGWVSARGRGSGRGQGASGCELTFTCKTLIPGAVELIRSLGIICGVSESDAVLQGRVVGRRWRIHFQSPFNPFSVPRKAERWRPLRTMRSQYRYVTAVEPCEPSPMRCIQVDSPSGTYLCGRRMVPTHNSTLLRQVGACAAQGVHPLRFDAISPVRVLVVDLENPVAAIAETGERLVSQLRRMTGDVYDPDRLRIHMRPDGMDLRSRHDRAELDRELALQRPQLVCIGPAYKLLRRRESSRSTESHEEATDPVLRILDDLRARYGFALMVEHHAPLAAGGARRELRPYGSQRWQAWPELGLGMRPDRDDRGTYEIERFRGDRLQADWPTSLQRGSVWPWVGVWRKREEQM